MRNLLIAALPAPFLAYLFVVGSPLVLLAPEAEAQIIEELVVTARRREENLQDVPLSVTAFDAEQLERAAFIDLEDVTQQTPGVHFNNDLADTRPGRLFSNVRVRGLEGSEFSTLATVSLFVDGVFALQGAQSLGLTDLERVEIIKGPQSSLFGRNSFAGAINYVTASPDMNNFGGKVLVDAGTYEQFDVHAHVEGPIVENKLAFRVGGRYYNRGEMFTASDGGALGEQSSRAVFATLVWQPVDALNLKLRAFHQVDKDGPEAIGFLIGRLNDTCSGTTRDGFDQAGNPVTLMPQFFICGTIPSPGNPMAPRVDSNTTLHPAILARQGFPNFLVDELLTFDQVPGAPTLDSMGLERRMTRVSLAGDYQFENGWTLSGTFSYNENEAENLRDWDITPFESWWVVNPQVGEDWGVDLRLESAADTRFRWSVGVNWYDQEFLTSSAGGVFAHACGIGAFFVPPLCDVPWIFPVGVDGGDYVEALGVYASVSYDILESLTVDIEARYLDDERSDGISGLSETFKNVIPRGSLTYRFAEDANLYFTYAQGILPGVINANIVNCNPNAYSVAYLDPVTMQMSTASECDQYHQRLGDDAVNVTPEQELNTWEIGIKTTWLDGRLLANLAYYNWEWTESPFSSFVIVVRDDNMDGVPNTNPNFLPVNFPGSSDYSGFELEVRYLPTENWSIDFNMTYNDNELTEFETRLDSAAATLGTRNVKGNRSSRFPEWSGNLSSTYGQRLNANWDWYARADVLYMGEAYAGPTNLAKLDSYFLVDARLGVEQEGGLRIEFYVKNLFNEDKWRGGGEFTDFSQMPAPFFDFNRLGISLLPQDKRTVGIRARLAF